MVKKISVAQLAWLCLIHVFFSGCVSYPQKQTFVLSVDREKTVRPTMTEKPLFVSRFRSAPQYESKGFVYRKGELDYESDYYNEFLALPGSMISEEVRKWLAASGIFRFVSDSPDIDENHYHLDGSVSALYADYSQGTSPIAVLEIRFSLSQKNKDRTTIIFQKGYRELLTVKRGSPEQLVKGWNEVLRNILTALEEDLSKLDYQW
jgi:cholesterol transport system auxiliary component